MIDSVGGFLLSVCTWASVNKARMDHECSTDPIKLASPVLRFRYIRFANTICLPSRKLPGDIVELVRPNALQASQQTARAKLIAVCMPKLISAAMAAEAAR